MQGKIVIAGASGFIGTFLQEKFIKENWKVLPIGRHEPTNWDNKASLIQALEGADVIINLAGRSVNCVHNSSNKKKILESRIRTTQLINEAIQACQQPPKLWINASGNAIYPRSYDQAMTEFDPIGDNTFMAEVCKSWEQALYANELPKTRRIAFRTGIVLGKNGGILKTLERLVKIGLGGQSGSGKQMMSWIHIEDYYNIVKFVMKEENISGALNICAPEPATNKAFMQLLRKSLDVPFGLPAPAPAIKIAAPLIGTEASLALDSYYTVSSVLPHAGYTFIFPNLHQSFVNFYEE
jgi:uncharacterized protein (TIGR01777 family)